MKLLLSRAWEMYEADKRIEGFSPQTLKAYKLQSTLLLRFYKDVQLDSITTNSAEASDRNYIGSIFNIKISNAIALLYCTFAPVRNIRLARFFWLTFLFVVLL
jgi:hypothetical protein